MNSASKTGITRTLWATACACLAWCVLATQSADASELPRSAPERQGIASSALAEFVAALDSEIEEVHSLMVLRHGQVVAEGWWEPYRPEFVHTLFSLSKSFTSTAVGFAVHEGLFSLDDRVVSFFPDDVPDEPSWNLEAMRVSDLLTMSTGHHGEDLREFSFNAATPLAPAFLQLPVAHKPGTYFLYNTPATYMCAAIVHRVTGQKLLDYLRPRLLDPLGIADATWSEDVQGIAHGGFGLSITTESIARFGQFYLQQGAWNGEQLLPADWVARATARQVSNGSDPDNDWDQGYGYQFWRSRHGSYRGDGAFGQFALVLPEQDAVVAITSGAPDMQAVLNVVWDRLLPAMQSRPLKDNPAETERLRRQLNSLSIRMPDGKPTAEGSRKWLDRSWQFQENELGLATLGLSETGEGFAVIATTRAGRHEIVVGSGAWASGHTGLLPGEGALLLGLAEGEGGQESHRMAAAGGWTGADEFAFRVAYTETPRITSFNLTFTETGLSVDIEHSAGFGQRQLPTLSAVPADG